MTLPVGVVLADRERRIIACNPAYERLVGYREAELCGRRFPIATHPDDAPADMPLYRAPMAGERDSYRIEKRYVHKDGRTVWGRLTVLPLQDAAGTSDRAIGLVEDITEVKALRDLLRRLLAHDAAGAADRTAARALLGPDTPDPPGARPPAPSPLRSRRRDNAPDDAPEPPELTWRGRQLLILLAGNKDNKTIASTLRLSDKTVRNNLSDLYDKLGVHSRGEAATWARQRDLGGDARH